jgi:hypothetical protein
MGKVARITGFLLLLFVFFVFLVSLWLNVFFVSGFRPFALSCEKRGRHATNGDGPLRRLSVEGQLD